MIADKIVGATVDAWTTILTLKKVKGITLQMKNTGGANSLEWRTRVAVRDGGPSNIDDAANTVTAGSTKMHSWNNPAWEYIVQVHSLGAGLPTDFRLEYVADVEQ